MIILVNWWCTAEPEVSTFETRELAEDHIKANLGLESGRIGNYDVYEGEELTIEPDGRLKDA